MSREELVALLDEIRADLDFLDHPWCLIGSAALIVAGVDWGSCEDVDILTTTAGAMALEARWAAYRDLDFKPDGQAPFRSRFSRYNFLAGRVEVMGDLQVWRGHRYVALDPGETVLHPYAGRSLPAPSLADQVRILKTFGRPKDLAKLAFVHL